MEKNRILDAWVDAHQEEMIEDLKKLIRINSIRGEAKEGMPFGEGPAEAIARMQEMMAESGLSVRNYDNYMVAGDLAGEGEKWLDILAHLDVVAVSKDWTVTEPFEPKIVGDRIYGRGAIDDKGPAVAALYAIRAIRESGIGLKHGVRLLCGADEECGSGDLQYYYTKEKEAKYTISPDASFPLINIEKGRLAKTFEAVFEAGEEPSRILCVEAGDTSNVVPGKASALVRVDRQSLEEVLLQMKSLIPKVSFTIEEGQKEGSWLLRAIGQTGHASIPSTSANALTAILSCLSRLEPVSDSDKALGAVSRLFPYGGWDGEALGVKMADEESGELTISLDIFSLKAEQGKVVLSGTFDCRAPIVANDENLTEIIRKKLSENGFRMEEGLMVPSHAVPADSPLVKTLLESYELYFGEKGEPLAIGGGTYVHTLANGVAFGCEIEGVDNHMHGDDEFFDIPVLVRSCKIFADAIIRICGKKEG